MLGPEGYLQVSGARVETLKVARFRNPMALRLCVLTVHLFRIACRAKLRERNGTDAPSILSEGPTRDAIWMATSGPTPRGSEP